MPVVIQSRCTVVTASGHGLVLFFWHQTMT
jgi:hypothetical protein